MQSCGQFPTERGNLSALILWQFGTEDASPYSKGAISLGFLHTEMVYEGAAYTYSKEKHSYSFKSYIAITTSDFKLLSK